MNEYDYLNYLDYKETERVLRLEELYLDDWENDAPELNGSVPVIPTDEMEF